MPKPALSPAQMVDLAAMAANPEIRDRLSESEANAVEFLLRHGHEVYGDCLMFRSFPDEGKFARRHYKKHCAFMAAGRYAKERAFVAGNRVGKTHTCSYEDAVHLTGMYPNWWQGRRFDEPVKWLVSGLSNESTRNILTPILLGNVRQKDGRNYVDGTGMIPASHFVPGTLLFRGGTGRIVSNIDIYYRDSKTEYSSLTIMSNQMGWAAFSGTVFHGVHLDEEHDLMVYSECITRTMTTEGIAFTSFTPLNRITSMVMRLLPGYREQAAIEERVYDPATGMFEDNAGQEEVTHTDEALEAFENVTPEGMITRKADGLGQWVTDDLYVMQVGWKDRPPHLPEGEMKRRLKSVPSHLRSAVVDGIPTPATGRVYPVDIGRLKVRPFPIPDHWPRAYALDPGWRVTAALWGAYDPDSQTWYMYREYKEGQGTPHAHARRITARDDWIPGVVDPAGLASSLNDGISVVERYRYEGLDLTPAINSVTAGIEMLYTLMVNNQFKIFSTLEGFESEFLTYRYNYNPEAVNQQTYGKPVKANDHLLDAARYLIMSGLTVATTRTRALEKKGRMGGWMQSAGQYGDSIAGY